MKKWVWAGIIALLLIGGFFIFNSKTASGNYDEFAKCLSVNKVKMYGAFWCPHCNNQKKEFGNSFKYVDYVECSLPDQRQNNLCSSLGIKGYPTWGFSNGDRVEGEVSFNELSQRTNCTLPS